MNRLLSSAVAMLCIAGTTTSPRLVNPDRIRSDQWHLQYLQVSTVHQHSRGDGITVAVVDTGVDAHPDLRDNIASGLDLTTNSERLEDLDPHGTGIAGLIAAHGRGPNSGALGIAPRSKILPIRDRDLVSKGTSDGLARGIEWAIEHGADVINISSGGGPSHRLRQAIDAAVRADVVVVAAAGNQPSDLGVSFPAAYDGVLAVGATDRNGDHAAVSVTGEKVGLSAPGVDIYSTSIDGKYSKATGTSAATAIVSGAVALVRSRFPGLSAREVVHRLTATAVDKGAPGRDEQYGYGVLDLVAALTADVPPLESGAPSPSGTAGASPPDGSGGSDRAAIWAAAVVLAVGVTALLVGLRRRQRGH